MLLYLKLITGEEILGTVEAGNTGMVKVTDALQFECGVDEGDPNRRYVYMARYAPFMADFIFEIESKKIVFQGSPSETVAKYYDVSLNYCRSCTDVSFKSCVAETTSQIATALKGPDPKQNEDLLEKMLLVAPGPSVKVH